MTDLPWLRSPAHQCSGACKHRAGIQDYNWFKAPKEEGAGRITSPVEGGTPQGPPAPAPDPLCFDCDTPLSEHTSPILKDGVVVGLANPENSCKRFVEE